MRTALPSLITGVVTGLIALAGVIYTQRRAELRQDARLREERDWQRELWARDHRRAAHMAFLTEYQRLDSWMMMYTRVGLEGVEIPKEDWDQRLASLLLDVQVFGSEESAHAAADLYAATSRLESGGTGDMLRVVDSLKRYRRLVQRDLGLAETDLGDGWEQE